tara:strand:- start:43 stop:912 length:870 start_codon:yes stop_codon:yes gene_type:complete
MKALYKQYNSVPQDYLKEKIDLFIDEDKAEQDLSTLYINQNPKIIKAHIIAEEEMVFCGQNIIDTIFKKNKIKKKCKEGAKLKSGDTIATLEDYHDFILTRERVLLNIIQRLSGISSLTDSYVKKLNSKEIKILDTRKTTPGIRLLEKYAVKIGSGYNHRLDLHNGVMLKDNHLTILSIEKINAAFSQIIKNHPNTKLQVEVDGFDQLKNIIKKSNVKIDAVLLDNMNEKEAKKCAQYIRINAPNCFIEVSGGINLNNITKYRNLNIDGISIGSLTHQAVSKNIKIEFE